MTPFRTDDIPSYATELPGRFRLAAEAVALHVCTLCHEDGPAGVMAFRAFDTASNPPLARGMMRVYATRVCLTCCQKFPAHEDALNAVDQSIRGGTLRGVTFDIENPVAGQN